MDTNFSKLKRKLKPYSRPTGHYIKVDNLMHCCPHCDEGFNPIQAMWEHEKKCQMKFFYDKNGKFLNDKCVNYL